MPETLHPYLKIVFINIYYELIWLDVSREMLIFPGREEILGNTGISGENWGIEVNIGKRKIMSHVENNYI